MLDAVSCLRPLLPRSFLRLLAKRAAPTTQAPPLVLVFIDATDSKRTDTWTSCAGTRRWLSHAATMQTYQQDPSGSPSA